MNKKIHIQHVLLSLQPGGLENGVVNVVNRLSEDRFESSICCLKHGGEFVARLKPGIPVHEMGWKSGNDPMLPFKLARLFRKNRPDVIHTRNAESFYYGTVAAKLAGIRCLVHSEHGRTFNDSPLRFKMQRWLSRHAHGIFAVSAQLKRDLMAHIGLDGQSLDVLYNGVDLERFGKADRNAIRSQLGFADTDIVIGSVGRLVAVKNYPLLLKAVAALKQKDVVVMLVGDGPERSALEALVRSLGLETRVRFMGHRDDVTSLLPAMDVFVLPSLSEGLSNTLLEAMASSVASVVSNVGGNPEIVTHERDGFLFANEDQAALADHLRRLCSDPNLRRRIGEAGRTRVVDEFSIRAMITRYEEFYLASLNRAGGKS